MARRSRLGGLLAAAFGLLVVAAFIGTLAFLYQKSGGDPPPVVTAQPRRADIERKAVASGSIGPRREVLIKPRVSGIVRKLHVEPGDTVAEGDLVAEIAIVPDVAQLTSAEAELDSARIALGHADREHRRAEGLLEKKLISRREMADLALTRDLRRAEVRAATRRLQVVKEGAAKGDRTANTLVRSTVAGTVLDVPIEEGASVIESNTFNEGTTVASVADMRDMVFLGLIDEADVDKLREEMAVNIRVGAIDDHVFRGTLEYIAPKGHTHGGGAIQFEIRASLVPEDGFVIRAGYSATAEIVLQRREQVLSVKESLLQFDGDQAYVDVEVAPGVFERRDVQLGVSDGIDIEILEGVAPDATIRKPGPAGGAPKS
ncbi:MAG: efflux RND transporter periplasmic adaptor subunit [Myxococcota bacterium]